MEVVVSDDGAGVSADDLPRIFEPFFRADRARTRQAATPGRARSFHRRARSCRPREVLCAPQRALPAAWR